MSTKKEKEINRLTDEFDMIQNDELNEFDISEHLANIDDLMQIFRWRVDCKRLWGIFLVLVLVA